MSFRLAWLYIVRPYLKNSANQRQPILAVILLFGSHPAIRSAGERDALEAFFLLFGL